MFREINKLEETTECGYWLELARANKFKVPYQKIWIENALWFAHIALVKRMVCMHETDQYNIEVWIMH